MDVSIEAQDEIKKTEKRTNKVVAILICFSTALALYAAILYMPYATGVCGNFELPLQLILIPMYLGLSIGAFFLAATILLGFKTTKRLIEIDDKLNLIYKELPKND